MDDSTTIAHLKDCAQKFCDDRDWGQFDTAKDIAIGVITEASELLEMFRFKTEQEINDMLQQPERREKISEELADVLYFLLRFSQKYDIDLATEFSKKMIKNEKHYPIEKSKGVNKKYTEL